MTFEFTVHPASLGKGYIKKVDLDPGIRFVLHHYTLKKDFYLKRNAPQEIPKGGIPGKAVITL